MRGSSLRNTAWVYGIAIYTGHETKVMMNASKNQPKFSKIEKATNKYIILGIVIQTVSCLVAAVIEALYAKINSWKDEQPTYLELEYDYDFSGGPPYRRSQHADYEDLRTSLGDIPTNFFAWFLAMQNFVPISLLVSLEMVKFFQGQFIESDHRIYCPEKGLPSKTQSSNLNEELGMVNYIFSDKTGTLT